MHGNAERARHGADRLRHLNIGARWCGVAGGVIVHEPSATGIYLIALAFAE
jgi:hypothetical protein